MEPEMESYSALLTQVNQLPTGDDAGTPLPAGQAPLPNGLGVLVRAGASLRRALLISVLLFIVSLAELGVLALYPGPGVAVVWDEKSEKPLVEAP